MNDESLEPTETQAVEMADLPAPSIAKDLPAVVTATDTVYGVEKFSAADLLTLRSDMMQSGVDSFQAAEIVTSFLSGRGYGVSNEAARTVAATIEGAACPVERIQSELERVARSA